MVLQGVLCQRGLSLTAGPSSDSGFAVDIWDVVVLQGIIAGRWFCLVICCLWWYCRVVVLLVDILDIVGLPGIFALQWFCRAVVLQGIFAPRWFCRKYSVRWWYCRVVVLQGGSGVRWFCRVVVLPETFG